jgi:ribonuclease HII
VKSSTLKAKVSSKKAVSKKSLVLDPNSKRSLKESSQFLGLLTFDADCHAPHRHGRRYLIGLDEVGRGSLIGSVVAGACCWPLDFSHESLSSETLEVLQTLNDSKQMKPETRSALAPLLHNIHHASLLASYRAFQKVLTHLVSLDETVSADDCFILLDGRCYLPQLPRHGQQAIVKGDGLSAVIAAASVVAKHARDTAVIELATQYPGYAWERNMGYATLAHRAGIETLGITPLHRQNYKVVHEQLALFENGLLNNN